MPSKEQTQTEVQSGYDRVAAEYAMQFCDEMEKKPFDRKMLDWLAERAKASGVICDLGCGPGQIASYLHSRGAKVCGIDLSAEMVRQAQRLNPDMTFEQGDMLALANVPDESFAAIAAFYSIIHIPRPLVTDALRELLRVLRPTGTLLLTFHIGNQTVHRDELLGKEVSLDFHFFETEEMKACLTSAGFVLAEAIERDPYPEVEYPSRRAYIFARKREAE
jgi:ubiquinone/menaquinone biosynthesis C-methylase UbiE